MASIPADAPVAEIVLDRSWNWNDEAWHRALCHALAGWLPVQRWFAGKALEIAHVALIDRLALDAHSAWVLLQVLLADGNRQSYQMLLCVAAEPGDSPIARLSGAAGAPQWLRDDPSDPGAAQALWQLIAGCGQRAGAHGQFRGHRTEQFAELHAGGSQPAARPLNAEQSNTSLVFDERLMLKLYRRVEIGANPDWELSLYLSQEAGYREIAAVAGGLEYAAAGQSRWLGILQALVTNRGDAWKLTLGQLQALIRSARQTVNQPPIERLQLAHAEVAHHLPSLALLGQRTAQLHRKLAEASGDAFEPEPADENYRRRWQERASAALDRTLAAIDHPPAAIKPADQALGQSLAANAEKLRAAFRDFGQQPVSAPRIRCHGDFHLGQVLATEEDFVLLDFEGEPARPLSERREKHLAVKDVAGMLRSFDYAAHVAVREWRAGCGNPDVDDLECEAARGVTLAWRDAATRIFLDAYQQSAQDSVFHPRDPAEFQRILQVHLLEKAVYELLYEFNHRPDWIGIPLEALAG